MLMRTLEFGLGSGDAEVAGHSLEGLYALTAWHLGERTKGQPGLGPLNAPGGPARP